MPIGGLALAATDAQYVMVLSESNQILETPMWRRTHDPRWVLHEFDLLGYAGRTIKLHFGVSNDGADPVTGMVVDDVSLVVCRPVGGSP
jgi:hypothetical protein